MNVELLKQLQTDLPKSVQEMIALIGFSNTLKVVQALGGTTWRVAIGRSAEGEAKREALAEMVGSEAEQLLRQHYAQNEIYLPRCCALLRKVRDLNIHNEYDIAIKQGLSARDTVWQLARQYQLSDRRVWDIVNSYIPDQEQYALFGS
ncbi:Mor transcription activator family protein [Pseudomonas sp. F1_0610]|uniref:Mor transcription activator family protein n=1 Tax=Pseudomonas sp. F1_0610 TaxID=3114284 RepID=UPI0039C45CDF